MAFQTLLADTPYQNIIHCYGQVIEEAIETLPQPNIDTIEMLQGLIIKAGDTALALIGKSTLDAGQTNEGYPHFSYSMEAEVFFVKGKIQHFINYLSTPSPSASTFYGSHHFIALKIKYSKTVQTSLSDKTSFQQALSNPPLSFAIRNFTLQRIPDRWVSFNETEGLKFSLDTPLYMEIRVHQRDKSLMERQGKEIDRIGKETIEKKQKQLQLISAKSALEEEKKEIEKKNPQTQQETQQKERELQSKKQKIGELEKELQKLETSLQTSQKEFSEIIKQPALNASCNPILRALSELSIVSPQETSQRLVLCLDKIFQLNQIHIEKEVFFSFSSVTSAAFKQKKLDFFRQWMKFLDTHYVETLTDLHAPQEKSNRKIQAPQAPLVKADVMAKEHLKDRHQDLQGLEQLVQFEESFLSLLSQLPEADYLLSNDKSCFVSQEQNHAKKLEEKLDAFLYSAVTRLIHLSPDKYAFMGFQFLRDRLELLDQALSAHGLLLTNQFGESRYLTPPAYAKERAFLDRYQLLLSYIFFFGLLSELQDNKQDNLLDILASDIHQSLRFTESPVLISNIPLLKILSKDLKSLFTPFKKEIMNLLSIGGTIEQILKTWSNNNLLGVILQWTAWKKEVQSLVSLIDSHCANLQSAAFSDAVIASLLKVLPSSDQLSKDIVRFKRDLKKFPLTEQADQAIALREQLKQRLKQVTDTAAKQTYKETIQYFTQFEIKALQSLKEALQQFPTLQSRRWFGQHQQSKHYEIKTHFFWPIELEGGDPHYESNLTHIPL